MAEEQSAGQVHCTRVRHNSRVLDFDVAQVVDKFLSSLCNIPHITFVPVKRDELLRMIAATDCYVGTTLQVGFIANALTPLTFLLDSLCVYKA